MNFTIIQPWQFERRLSSYKQHLIQNFSNEYDFLLNSGIKLHKLAYFNIDSTNNVSMVLTNNMEYENFFEYDDEKVARVGTWNSNASNVRFGEGSIFIDRHDSVQTINEGWKVNYESDTSDLTYFEILKYVGVESHYVEDIRTKLRSTKIGSITYENSRTTIEITSSNEFGNFEFIRTNKKLLGNENVIKIDSLTYLKKSDPNNKFMLYDSADKLSKPSCALCINSFITFIFQLSILVFTFRIPKMEKMRNTIFLLLAIGHFLLSCQPTKPSPNIVIILADDLGYGDPQVYNSESKIPTPNIDQLASQGMRFTDAHTPSSVCTPTRYGLLTGRYAWRTALKESVLWMWDKPLIAQDQLTFPKMLKTKNYATACIGKWHLGWRWPSNTGEGYMNDTIPIGDHGLKGRNELWKFIDFTKPLGGGPLEVGFDYYFGDDVPNFAPYTFFENNKLVKIPGQIKPNDMYGAPGPMAEGWKLEEVMPEITRQAVKYIEEQSQTDQPFFLYFALTAPHTPIAPTDQFKGKSEAGAYGDFVHEVDWSVGQIVEALKKSGELENTLLVFTSDNGSPQRDGTDMGGVIASVKKYGHDPSRPWRGMKADIWEGGHRVPFIASWPGKIEEGAVSDQVICLTDMIASVASILGFEKGSKSMEDSYDISPILFGVDQPVRENIVHHSIDGTFAIRQGPWKLIMGKDSGGFSKNLKIEGIPVETDGQLYNLSDDPGEGKNLYIQHPEKVMELSGILDQYKISGRSNL